MARFDDNTPYKAEQTDKRLKITFPIHMKSNRAQNRVTLTLCVASFIAVCASTSADTTTPTAAKPVERKLSPQELLQQERNRQQFEKFEAQAKASAEARRLQNAARLTSMVPANLVKQYDTNGNGLIDPPEWRKYRADVDKRTAELLRAKAGN
jgi:hypothetical protein